MKYKKYSYILVLILMLVVGIPKPLAASDDKMCYYMTEDELTFVYYNATTGYFHVKLRSGETIAPGIFLQKEKDPLINNGKDKQDEKKYTGILVSAIEKGTCPTYVVYRRKLGGGLLDRGQASGWGVSEGFFGFNFKEDAKNFADKSAEVDGMNIYTLSYQKPDGSKLTQYEFENYLTQTPNDEINCDGIFGSKDDPESIRYLINEILQYPKIIVPILIIVLGMFDFAKAVLAGSEEKQKKATTDFVKRVLMGIAVFFIPVLVDILMYLADIVWAGTGYTSCGL